MFFCQGLHAVDPPLRPPVAERKNEKEKEERKTRLTVSSRFEHVVVDNFDLLSLLHKIKIATYLPTCTYQPMPAWT